jgi:hypothetical protein
MNRLHLSIEKYKYPVLVVVGWVVILLVLSNLLFGCQHPRPENKPSTFQILTSTETAITTGATTLKRAVTLGTVTTSDPEYAVAYSALHSAGATMDMAWEVYRAGQLEAAEAQSSVAMDFYMTARPFIQRLSENQ